MLLATFLALGAAVIHAGWNFVAKAADGDRHMVLWAQFLMAGLLCLPLAVGNHVLFGMPGKAYLFAAMSGLVHIPYVVLLAKAYTVGDFSVGYPIARGGGAALAAVGGVLFLSDHLTGWHVAGISVVIAGLGLLAVGGARPHVMIALAVAATIGVYSVLDAAGSRAKPDTVAYVFATMIATATTNTTYALATGRGAEMVAVLRRRWRTSLFTGAASTLTYGMVVVAFRLAPVGYVTALRECSVVLAALAGWRLLGEGDHRRRLAAAGLVAGGILLLVLARG
ncbi:MAG: EamA family transporter [Acidimicrobiaceae bacterium]|nr:EamA family transporter [Ilumatobacter sp.]MCB9382278.1 EamA family transporter [Acidimicrobiaceae bacterium]